MLRSLFDSVVRMGMTIVVLCGGFTACRDHSSPESTSIRNRGHTAAISRQMPRLKGESEWIGQAHNKALNDLRAEMRRPGMMSNNICEYLTGFTTRPDRFPENHAKGHAKDRLSIARSVLTDGKVCRPDPVRSVVTQDDGAYSGVSSLLAQIQEAIDLASDRYDLAQRLGPIWNAAAGLSESESAIVAATLVTAQSSFEYWEVEIDRAFREFEAEYAECARTASSDGADYDQARQFCLDGGLLPTLGPRYAPNPVRSVGLVPKAGCALSGHFKNLAKADAAGAFTGAIKGAISAGLAGIGSGALVGGIVGSAGSWVNSAWELYKCALK